MKRSLLILTLLTLVLALVPVLPAAAQQGTIPYTVQPGDSLYRIAAKFHSTVEDIEKANNLKDTVIHIGEVLQIPQGSAVSPTAAPAASGPVLILATTTSTADSGLLTAILPYFEYRDGVKVKVIAVGTGQALAIGARGDADVVLVHARAQEDKFVADGSGVNRRDVMYNDFVIVGPASDPAGIASVKLGKEAFAKIASAGAPFASRGDASGTNTKEISIWTSLGLKPKSGANGYVSLGQGMGETLQYANQKGAYTLTDRGTWLALKAKLPNLTLLVGGTSVKTNPDKTLFNPYGVIAVNPAKFPKVNYKEAMSFIEWITSLSIQRRIYEFGRDLYNQSLFYPVAQTP